MRFRGGNTVDEEKIANILMEDFRSGRLGKITLERPGVEKNA